MFPVVLTSDHAVLLLAIAAICFECVMIGFVVVGRARTKVFTEEFMNTHFHETHFTHTHETIKKGGYPDMGNGRYSEKLSYKDWLHINNAQRAHYNFVEQITPTVVMLLIGGIIYPIPAAAFGWTYFVARIFYCFYASEKGASHPLRRVGALLGDIPILGAFILSVMSCAHLFNTGTA
mmetsp:Transcript_6084/g.6692  ORF Transcript_6084/g.6692 Transcript_6084/m.6692 type:complete len:178 (+) Transcript_6084:20-553(+)